MTHEPNELPWHDLPDACSEMSQAHKQGLLWSGHRQSVSWSVACGNCGLSHGSFCLDSMQSACQELIRNLDGWSTSLFPSLTEIISYATQFIQLLSLKVVFVDTLHTHSYMIQNKRKT